MENYTYLELLEKLDGRTPSYLELLKTAEWRSYREAVLKRDNQKCRKCETKASMKGSTAHYRDHTPDELSQLKLLNQVEHQLREPDIILDDGTYIKFKNAIPIAERLEKPLYLHVHHHYYIFQHLPWEYEIDDLETLCAKCHEEFHQKHTVPYYMDSSKQEKLSLTPCSRCHGAGHLSQYSYHHGGICFHCHGAKYEELIGLGHY